MGYLVCEKCGGYYKLQDGESPDDFEDCQCGGKLDYYETLPEHADFDQDNKYEHTDLNRRKQLLQNMKDTDYILNLYQAIHEYELEEKQIKYEKNMDKFFSSNFMVNSGFIILTFTIIPLYYGFLYSNWIFYLVTVISIFLSLAFFFLKNAQDTFDNSHFQKMFIFTGAVYGLTTLNLLTLFGNPEFLQDLIPRYYNRGGLIILYGVSVYFSAYFCYTFLKNSQMKEKIDFLNLNDKEDVYFNYYYIIFALFLIMISSIVLMLLWKFTH